MSGNSHRGQRVLLVDDDRNLLAALRRALSREPYEVVVAESADAALRIQVILQDQLRGQRMRVVAAPARVARGLAFAR